MYSQNKTIQGEENKEAINSEIRALYEEKMNNAIKKCKEEAARVEEIYNSGQYTDEEERHYRIRAAYDAWRKDIKPFCDANKIDSDDAYQALYAAVGITMRKVPVRYYPTVQQIAGSFCCLREIENVESLFDDCNPVGKVFQFKITMDIGKENVLLDYSIKVKRERIEPEEKRADWKDWRCFDGSGKIEGYGWADVCINIREQEGVIQSVAIQKTYVRWSDPIWKMRSAYPDEMHTWIELSEENPDNFEIPEGEFYSDETLNPPIGRNYKTQGILAYDDTEEIVILGIRDPDAEIVEIPREINGKPVTVLDKRCFENCSETLRKVILPDTLKEIGDDAFVNCRNLEKPLIPASVTKIGKNVI